MRSRRQVRKNPAPKASKRRKPAQSATPPAPLNRIRELRKRARMSLQDLSHLTGEPLPTLARWETGGGITLEKLAKVAEALHVPLVELVAQAEPVGLSSDERLLLQRFSTAASAKRETIIRVVQALAAGD